MRVLTLASVGVLFGTVGIVVACAAGANSSVGVGGGSCQTLAACCASLSGAAQTGCLEVVSIGIDAECSAEQTTACGSTSGGGCTALASCCAAMPAASAAGCAAIVTEGNAATCGLELQTYETTGACGGPGSGPGSASCGSLAACCPLLPASSMASCLGIVSAGNAVGCASNLATAESAGFCTTVGTGTGTGLGSGTGTGTGCSALAACCPSLPGASVATCDQIVSAGNVSACDSNLATAVSAGYCGGGTGTGTGVGTGTGTGGGTGTGTGTGTGSGTGTGTTGTCANPSTTLTPGFVPPVGIIGSGCTKAETQGWGTCLASFPTTDAGINVCDAYISVPDGNFNTCGNCVEGTTIIPGQPIPASWGSDIIGAVYGTLGDEGSLYLVNIGANFGGCVVGADPVAGRTCGLAAMAVEACEFAVCLPLCPVPEADVNNPGAFNDLVACTKAADNGACASYIATETSACQAIVNAQGTDPVSKCNVLTNVDNGVPDAGTATAAQEEDLIGLICGGVDAGF